MSQNLHVKNNFYPLDIFFQQNTHNIPLLRIQWISWQGLGLGIIAMSSQFVFRCCHRVSANALVASLQAKMTGLLNCEFHLELGNMHELVDCKFDIGHYISIMSLS